jgi:hypothetical protein
MQANNEGSAFAFDLQSVSKCSDFVLAEAAVISIRLTCHNIPQFRACGFLLVAA